MKILLNFITKKSYFYCEKKGFFLISWMPHLCVSMFNIIFRVKYLHEPALTSISLIIGNSSMVWSSLVYLFLEKKLPKKVFFSAFSLSMFSKPSENFVKPIKKSIKIFYHSIFQFNSIYLNYSIMKY